MTLERMLTRPGDLDNMEDNRNIDVSTGVIYSAPSINTDPFLAGGEDLKAISYENASLKRKNSRSMAKAYTGMDDAKSKFIELSYYSAYHAFDVVLPSIDMAYLAKLYEISTPNYAAINAKASNIVGLGYRLEPSDMAIDKLESAKTEEQLQGIRKKIEKGRREVNRLLEELNYEDTFLEILLKVWVDYEATGNGYIEIGRTANGTIGYVGHIPSPSIRIRRLRDGYIQLVNGRAVFFRNFKDKKTKDPINNDARPNEIIHIKKYTPTTTFYGIPDALPAKSAIAGDEFSARFNLDYFEHKAVPRYVIIVKGATLSAEAEKTIHEFFVNNLKGKNHRSIYIPLPSDSADSKVEFKMEPVEAGIQDSSFTTYRDANRTEILMAHRVPISKVGQPAGVNLAAARDADKSFKEQVTRPEQDRLEKRINGIISEFTNMFVFKLNEMTLTDEDAISQINERYVRNQIMTPNEARATIGMPPIDGGDEMFEMKPQQAADAAANAGKTRARDAQRSAGATDGKGEGRNPKGDGRSTQ